MCYNQTKFVKNELYMERFLGNGLKNLNSAVILIKARGWCPNTSDSDLVETRMLSAKEALR